MGSKIIQMHAVHGQDALQRKPGTVTSTTNVSRASRLNPSRAPWRDKPTPGVRAPVAALLQRKTTQAVLPTALAPGKRLPALPPVYAPRQAALQTKAAPARQVERAVAGPFQPGRPGVAAMAALAPRIPVAGVLPIQCSRAATKAEKGAQKQISNSSFTLTYDSLDDNSFLYALRASGPVAAVPPNTQSQMTIKTFLSKDLGDAADIRKKINDTLQNPTIYRNMTSDSPIHKNMEGRLPMYGNREVQPNLEYLAGKGGRIIVDVVSHNVYFSHHYGDDTVKAAKDAANPKHVASKAILKAMGTTSAHVLLDPGTWNLGPIIADADTWWAQFAHTL